MLGRRRAVQADHDLGRTGGDRLKRLCDIRQIGRQCARAHHCAAGADCTLAVMMMWSRSVLRGGLVMRMRSGVVMRSAVMYVAGLHLVMRREEISQKRIVEAWRWTTAASEACGGREHAEQIGESDDPPHCSARLAAGASTQNR